MAKNKISNQDASRIQRNADRSGTNQGFKARTQGSTAFNARYFTKEEALDILSNDFYLLGSLS